MDSKNDLKNLVEAIKFATGLTQAEIAETAGYTRSYLSDAISKGGNRKIQGILEKTFAEELKSPPKTRQIPTKSKQQSYATSIDVMIKYTQILQDQISLLKEQVADLRSSIWKTEEVKAHLVESELSLQVIEAHSATTMNIVARVVALLEKKDLKVVQEEMGKAVAARFRASRKKGIGIPAGDKSGNH